MEDLSFRNALEEIVEADSRYDIDAYWFIREALDFTVKQLKKSPAAPPAKRHVTGQELLDGIREYALREYGPMTLTVLHAWGIRQCGDFGEMVFNMVGKQILGRNEEDSKQDFEGGYDFAAAFVKPFQPKPRPLPHETAGRTRSNKCLKKSAGQSKQKSAGHSEGAKTAPP